MLHRNSNSRHCWTSIPSRNVQQWQEWESIPWWAHDIQWSRPREAHQSSRTLEQPCVHWHTVILIYDTVQSLAARVNASLNQLYTLSIPIKERNLIVYLQSLLPKAVGCKFIQLPPVLTQLPSTKPVIAVCATRTGTGKSQTFIADYLKKQGKKIAVARHPMPYDQVLLTQRCQRYEVLLEDLLGLGKFHSYIICTYSP